MTPTLQQIYDGPRQFQMHRWDHYIPVYEKWFAPWRDKPVRLLEIGVQHGGGLEMWHKYFHNAELILGVDINPSCQFPKEPNITVEIGNQADVKFWYDIANRYNRFDIIIDDGGHTWMQQLESFMCMYRQVSKSGLYVVEDTHTSVWGGEFADMRKSFLDVAAGHAKALMGWSGERGNFFKLMNLSSVPQEEQDMMLHQDVSDFTRYTIGVHFYDSMVIYERGVRVLPTHALR